MSGKFLVHGISFIILTKALKQADPQRLKLAVFQFRRYWKNLHQFLVLLSDHQSAMYLRMMHWILVLIPFHPITMYLKRMRQFLALFPCHQKPMYLKMMLLPSVSVPCHRKPNRWAIQFRSTCFSPLVVLKIHPIGWPLLWKLTNSVYPPSLPNLLHPQPIGGR